MNVKVIPLPTSFVVRRLKMKHERGAGEAKLHVGSVRIEEELDSFFEDFSSENDYFFKKDDLLEYLERIEIEYVAQKISNYKDIDLAYHREQYERIESLPTELYFNLDKHTDNGGRYYIRESVDEHRGYKVFQDILRSIALPRITDLVITKSDKTFTFQLQLNYEKILQNDENEPSQDHDLEKLSHQRIVFGAPGTGKSYQLNKEAENIFAPHINRVTFHPSYLYSNFVGSFKPYPKYLIDSTTDDYLKDEHGNIRETITYKFVPGILVKVFIQAIENPEKKHLLIIEEINRANVSAVFGDMFQLLDRSPNGSSQYSITLSEELRDYFKLKLQDEMNETQRIHLGENMTELVLPNNLYIWATMNSADQGVLPIDAAFRRRWDFTYLGINDIADKLFNEFDTYYFKSDNTTLVKWDAYRRAVNERLSGLNVPEDKLIGPYFISKSVLESGDYQLITDTIQTKVLMYLYEDAVKPYRGKLFAEGKFSTFSDLCKEFNKDALGIFKEEIDIETYDIEETEEAE